jgi:hypothetical protein
MEHDYKSNFGFVKNANSGYTGLQVAYGLTKRITIDLDGGYYLNRTQNFSFFGDSYTLNGYGGSAITLSGRASVLKDTVNDVEVTLGVGLKMPWSRQPQIVDGVELTEDVQPCNGSYGLSLRAFIFKEFDKSGVRLFLMHNTTLSTINDRNYKEGNNYTTSLYASKTFFKNLTLIGQVRNEVRDYAFRDDKVVSSSGGFRFVFVPQINYSFKQKYNLSVLYELPFYQYYYGIQLHDQYAFSVNLNIRLGLNKKVNAECEKPK